MNLEEPIVVTAPDAAAGERLDRFLATALADRMPAVSRSRVQALIAGGCVSDEAGTLGEASRKVKPGQRFRVRLPPPEDTELRPEARDLSIVYEDDALIVLDKPADLVVHPAPGAREGTLVHALLAHCGDSLAGIGGVRRPGIVHRLDKDTTGLMVVAKTEAAHASLTRQFAARSIDRRYLALAWGLPATMEGEIEGNIGRHPRQRQKMARLASGGRPAVTRYRVLESLAGGAVSHLSCRLLTGRTHQIRVHLASEGHALLGDPLYGRVSPARLKALSAPVRASVASFPRQALHAATLGFHHPVSKEWLKFETCLPQDQQSLLDILREDGFNAD